MNFKFPGTDEMKLLFFGLKLKRILPMWQINDIQNPIPKNLQMLDQDQFQFHKVLWYKK